MPSGLRGMTALSIAFHISPVWCRTPHEYTMSNFGSACMRAGSSTEPCSAVQRGSLPAAISRTLRLVATEFGS